MAELGLEVIDADVILDLLELCHQRNLRLHQGCKLLLGDGSQLADESEILILDDGDRLLYNCFLDDQRATLLSL